MKTGHSGFKIPAGIGGFLDHRLQLIQLGWASIFIVLTFVNQSTGAPWRLALGTERRPS